MSDDAIEFPDECEEGFFYGFPDTEDNYLHPGDKFQIQWGAYDEGRSPINITLSRYGGHLVDNIAERAVFTTSSSLYRLFSPSPDCMIEQYNWTIPADIDTTDPKYQFGLFNADAVRNDDFNGLGGWLDWSPFFYIGQEPTDIASTTTETGSATQIPATSTSTSSSSSSSTPSPPPSSSSSSGLSTGAKAGIGVGAGVLGLALIMFLIYYFRRRSTAAQVPFHPQTEKPAAPVEKDSTAVRPPIHEMDAHNYVTEEPVELPSQR